MTKILTLIVFSVVLSQSILNAQTAAGQIAGKVTDDKNAPIAFANVLLFNALDSTLVKAEYSTEEGAYEFRQIPAGRYRIAVSYVGYADASTGELSLNAGATLQAPVITMASSATELKEVVVAARKPLIEVRPDKTVFNVEGSINAVGNTAFELLRKSPGVVVDNNDNIILQGKNGVNVYIDGRPSPLTSADLAALLKTIQSSEIEAIEIITQPSSKYDAAGNAGIINIRMRRDKRMGANGNVELGFAEAIYPKYNGAASLNYRNKTFNVFGKYSLATGDNWSFFNLYREQSGLTFDQQSTNENEFTNHNIRAGADFFLGKHHTIGVLATGFLNDGTWDSKSKTLIADQQTGLYQEVLYARSDNEGNRDNLNANINYRFADTSGRSLNIDLDHGLYRIRGNSLQPNIYRSADGQTVLNTRNYRSITPTDIDISTAKVDYEQPMLQGTVSIGLKVANVRTDNTFDFFNVVNNGEIKDLDVSNRFKYRERTSAGYVNYQHQFGKLHVQAGLRVENTDYSGDLITHTPQNGEKVENNYTEWFPSAALTYKINEKIGMNLTYSRRIARPSYQDLTPFEFKLDELTYQKGNPLLRPQFTNSLEFSPTYQGMPLMTLGYSHTKDLFTQVLDTTNVRATFLTNENIADQKNYTLTLNVPTPIAKWWEGFFSLTGFHSDFSAEFRDGYIADQQFTAFNVYGEQTFRLPKGISIQLSGWYNSRAFWGTLRSNPQGAMDLAVQKKVLGDKGEIRLRFGDILNTAGWGGENVFTPGLKMKARGNWESRTVTLNFSYRFGSAEVKGARQRKTGLEDESRRVKSGQN